MARAKKITAADVTIETCKQSKYGCHNCLWYGAECRNAERFRPAVYENTPTCEGYCYYD